MAEEGKCSKAGEKRDTDNHSAIGFSAGSGLQGLIYRVSGLQNKNKTNKYKNYMQDHLHQAKGVILTDN